MIIDGSAPAALAAQQIAGQREALQQRGEGQRPSAFDQAQTEDRIRNPGAGDNGPTQTQQAVSAADGEQTRLADDPAERNAAQTGRVTPSASAGGEDRPAPPPEASGRGQQVDIFA